MVCRSTAGSGRSAGSASAKSSQELAWEVVDQRLKQWENQSWQLHEEDLAICLRPDGSDWRLGTGSYGTVSPTTFYLSSLFLSCHACVALLDTTSNCVDGLGTSPGARACLDLAAEHRQA